jgi:hypothetical protein
MVLNNRRQQNLNFSVNATKTRSNLATEDTSYPISKKNTDEH